MPFPRLLAITVVVLSLASRLWAGLPIPVGLARIDITPTNAVRLMGYAARQTESTNADSPLHARAIAIGQDGETAVLLTADNCILPAAVTATIRQRLGQMAGVTPERFALAVNHTHSAPCLTGAAPNIFAHDLTPAELQHIDEYTGYFTERLVTVALAALSNRQPALVSWGMGRATFAQNRRTPGGPVDPDVPLLRVTAPDGTLRGTLLNYACHCTTLGGEFNQSHPDWTGVCARELEASSPGLVALVAVGCGADANPSPRGTLALVEQHGRELAREATALQAQPLAEINSPPTCRLEQIALPYQPHFTREQWVSRATNSGIVGYHARRWLTRQDQGDVPPAALNYPVQTWVFGDSLAMVFLGGEVVVDYSRRLKQELDSDRLWINAYANDVPCYIPSRRILREGGYEAESSLWYYDRPQQLSPEVEDRIVSAVRQQLPDRYRANRRALENPPAPPPEAARAMLRVPAGLQVQLMAAEPLIESPVAIDFARDGSLWVAEMRDYPEGLDGRGQPGGRIKRLRDLDGDGRFDTAEIWADGLAFPTGLIAVDDGVLVGAAPDILRIEARPGEAATPAGPGIVRRATLVTAVFTGFDTHNFQARVNGFRWGLDGWIHGSGGLFGGRITGVQRGETWDCSGRDFRFHPDTGRFESQGGVSQQGRPRDDFGNWFGNDNGTLLWHFPWPDRYSRLNPHVPPPSPRHRVAGDLDPGAVYPRSRTLARFNDFGSANRLTSACGPEIYRAHQLGEEYFGNALVCEPVHNLVRRAVLTKNGPTFQGRRAPGESRQEFLSSRDPWFRPVEVRTGTDGALWVVDFARFVVEHPRWIPAERLKQLNPRAGAELGRIYRVFATHTPPGRPASMLTGPLGAEVTSDNGARRDLAARELRRLHRMTRDAGNSPSPTQRAALAAPDPSANPAVRVQRAWLGNELDESDGRGWADETDPQVRRALLPLLEEPQNRSAVSAAKLRQWESDQDSGVRYQLALTFGQIWNQCRNEPGGLLPDFLPDAIPRIARAGGLTNEWLRAAVTAAAGAVPEAELLQMLGDAPLLGPPEYLHDLLRTAAGRGDADWLFRVTEARFPIPRPPGWADETAAFAWAERVVDRPEMEPQLKAGPAAVSWQNWTLDLDRRATALLEKDVSTTPPEARAAATRWWSRTATTEQLLTRLDAEFTPARREVLLNSLRRREGPDWATNLLHNYAHLSPAHRTERVEMLTLRESSIPSLLAALERGDVAPAELSTTQRQRLRSHPEPGVASRAQRLWPTVSTDRATVVAGYQDLPLATADRDRGRALFSQHCATCHRVGGRGFAVGPDLSTFQNKPTADWVVAIFDPSAAIDPRYLAQTVELPDGRRLTGIIDGETSAGFTLHQPGGLHEIISRGPKVRLIPSVRSLMPEGFEQLFSRDDAAGLMAWLITGPTPMGNTGVPEGLAAQRVFSESGVSRVRRLQSSEPVQPYASWLSPLPLWYCRQTDGQSRVTWEARPLPTPGAGGAVRFRFAIATGLVSAGSEGFRLRLGDQSEVLVDAELGDTTWTSADGRLLGNYTVREHNAEDSCGVLEITAQPGVLVPAGGPPPEWVSFELTGRAAKSQRWFGLYEVPGTIE